MNKVKKCSMFVTIMFVILFTSFGCSSSSDAKTSTVAYNEATTPHYDVVKREEQITIDGKLDEKVWESVPTISGGFHFPWDDKEAPFTEFKAFHDEKNFYFSFYVKDEDIVVDKEWKDDESTVDDEDRVELFFAGGNVDKPGEDGMEKYYGIEIDPDGRVHDYSIEYYRNFDSKWNLEGLETKATRGDDYYIVEGKIPMQSLNDLNLIHDNVMRTGVYRADFSKKDDETIMEWISWVDPKTKNPDFHVNSSFGEFRFLK